MDRKKIVVVTATRAEYGLLKTIIQKLRQSEYFQIELAVTGMHLSPEFGSTYREIEEDGIEIDNKIEILLGSDTPVAMSKTMGLAMISFAEYFDKSKPDAVMVLGDRYETLAVCCAAMNARIPIFHLHGGEATEGAIDEAVRHAISKMSYFHFTSTEIYRKRVIQIGESPDRVFNVGAVGVENVLQEQLMSKSELEESLRVNLDRPYAVVTFHPVTLESGSVESQMQELLDALDEHPEYIYICTKANADAGGRKINQMLEAYVSKRENVSVYGSLGMKRYLSAVKYAAMVIGNSSSGIIEVPSFGIPTINIGDRQRGRIQADSIINCPSNRAEISKCIRLAQSDAFCAMARKVENPYGAGNTSDAVLSILEERFATQNLDMKKKFYDLSF